MRLLKDLFPDLKLIERKEIAEVEPHVVEGRTQADELVALSTPDGYAIDYQRLSAVVCESVGGAKIRRR